MICSLLPTPCLSLTSCAGYWKDSRALKNVVGIYCNTCCPQRGALGHREQGSNARSAATQLLA